MKWSSQQDAIFKWFESGRENLVVRARAGTGKTTTVLEGIDRAPEGKILLAAFNKSIANELQGRLRNPRAQAMTLHGLGYRFVRRNWSRVKVENGKRAFRLATEACPRNTPDPIVRLVAKLHTKVRELRPWVQHPGGVIQIGARFDLLPSREWAKEGWDDERVAGLALRAVQLAKNKSPTIDFADMIFLPLANRWVRPWFDLVVIDEAQDMSPAQLELATKACKKRGRICVVGDDRQAIYGFRGADPDGIDNMKDSLRAEEMGLTVTYRCPKLVVNEARELVPDYEAHPSAPDGEIEYASEDEMLSRAREGDFILSRKNAPLAGICIALLRRGVRAKIKGRDVARNILDLVESFETDDVQLTLEMASAWREIEVTRAELIDDEQEQDERVNEVTDRVELIHVLSEGLTSTRELVARIESLFSDRPGRQMVMCSTVHRAKGLEAPRVWMLDGTFRKGFVEEENLRYVAITRAQEVLVHVGARSPEQSKEQ